MLQVPAMVTQVYKCQRRNTDASLEVRTNSCNGVRTSTECAPACWTQIVMITLHLQMQKAITVLRQLTLRPNAAETKVQHQTVKTLRSGASTFNV